MEVSQAERVLRAQHDFGVLAIGVTQIVPSDTQIRERAAAVRDAVAAERAAGDVPRAPQAYHVGDGSPPLPSAAE